MNQDQKITSTPEENALILKLFHDNPGVLHSRYNGDHFNMIKSILTNKFIHTQMNEQEYRLFQTHFLHAPTGPQYKNSREQINDYLKYATQ